MFKNKWFLDIFKTFKFYETELTSTVLQFFQDLQFSRFYSIEEVSSLYESFQAFMSKKVVKFETYINRLGVSVCLTNVDVCDLTCGLNHMTVHLS